MFHFVATSLRLTILWFAGFILRYIILFPARFVTQNLILNILFFGLNLFCIVAVFFPQYAQLCLGKQKLFILLNVWKKNTVFIKIVPQGIQITTKIILTNLPFEKTQNQSNVVRNIFASHEGNESLFVMGWFQPIVYVRTIGCRRCGRLYNKNIYRH